MSATVIEGICVHFSAASHGQQECPVLFCVGLIVSFGSVKKNQIAMPVLISILIMCNEGLYRNTHAIKSTFDLVVWIYLLLDISWITPIYTYQIVNHIFILLSYM